MTSDEIRSSFLEFFRARDHVIERSDTIVPSNDPTLLFSSAGMVQFKPYYSGEVPVPYRRAATAQKCLRAGGKANDLDEVGKTTRHMTFFEMLGNFSFGDYFKREAIQWGWEYSTQTVKMDGEKIWVSVFEDDDEAYDIWHKEIGIPADRIIRLGVKDNFWGPAGETGACGPCSELHLDRGEHLGAHSTPGDDPGERFIEYWNLVFPQFDQQPDGSRPTLKNRGIDTGMGLERLAALLQGVETVFDTDGIRPIIERTRSMTSIPYEKNPTPYRVIADHIRALSFLIADGVLPSNEGRGYVERRLLRRAARFGRELGLEKPFLHEVSETVVDLMSHQYPELAEKRLQIARIIQIEEERFQSTLARGMDLLEETFAEMSASRRKVVPGEDLFKLHDTFGFPLDLATDIAEDRGFTIDREGFQTAMNRQREMAKKAWAGSGEESISPIYHHVRERTGATTFRGYRDLEWQSEIRATLKKGKEVERLSEGDEGEVVLDATPFYAEAGGQVGDTGTIDAVNGNAHVITTKRPLENLSVHGVKVSRGELKPGDRVTARVDTDARRRTQGHHTATHLLQAALRDILGDHVHQAGSLVAPDRLRFDFTHFRGIEPERLEDIERRVNEYIRGDHEVSCTEMPLEKARAAGAMALFGEKYGDVVRVVRAGSVSMELCGGTHVVRTGAIGLFKILSESSVAAGVRRIEAVCGECAEEVMQRHERQLSATAQMVNAPADHVADRVALLLEENKRLVREVSKWKQAAVAGGGTDHLERVREVSGVKVLALELEGQDPNGLRMAVDTLRDKLGSGVVVVGSRAEDRVSLCVGVTKDLTGRVRAGDVVKAISPIVGGGGGGRPDLAQAGGKIPEKLPEALEYAARAVQDLLGSQV